MHVRAHAMHKLDYSNKHATINTTSQYNTTQQPGTVYRGTWRNLPVAVKTVVFQDRARGGEKAQRRAITEAAITTSVSHPNVVATLSYDLQPMTTRRAAPGNFEIRSAAAAAGAAAGAAADGSSAAAAPHGDGSGVDGSGAGGGGGMEGEVTDWKLFLVQEFCNGGSLRQAVDARSVFWDAEANRPKLVRVPSVCVFVCVQRVA